MPAPLEPAASSTPPIAASPRPARADRWRRLWLVGLLVALACSYPATALLPLSVAWENGWLENLQVAVLLGGAAMALTFARTDGALEPGARKVTPLAWALLPVWCLLAARELSWGAVFLPPVEITQEGPVFSSSQLWYKPAVYPAAAAVLAWSGWRLLRCRADRFVSTLWRSGGFIWPELMVFILAGMLSTYAEEHLGIAIAAPLHGRTLIMEEWAEVVAYGALVLGQWQVLRTLRRAVS